VPRHNASLHFLFALSSKPNYSRPVLSGNFFPICFNTTTRWTKEVVICNLFVFHPLSLIYFLCVGVTNSEKTNKQALLNKLARCSCEALACLAGFRSHTPENDGVQNSLRALLTPYICHRIRSAHHDTDQQQPKQPVRETTEKRNLELANSGICSV
jgi:hypothetical protein